MKTPPQVYIVAFLAIIAFLLLLLQGCVIVNKEINIYVDRPNVDIKGELK